MKIATVKEIMMCDSRASDEFGIKSELLMENAGDAVYDAILKHSPIEGRNFIVFSGIGGNGGDGFVVARKLSSAHGHVSVFIVGDKNKIASISKTNLERLNGFPVEVFEISHINRLVATSMMNCDVIVDAIFGIGLSRKINGIYEDIIDEINRSGKFIVSIDIPSGVNGDTGEVMGVAVKASCTVTFGLPKIGEFQYPGAEYTGNLYVSTISYPPKITDSEEISTELNIPPPLPERNKNGHKGDFGKAMFIAGSRMYLGAPFFNSAAFLKGGGGVSFLATCGSIANSITTLAREVITLPLKETSSGTIAYENADYIIEQSTKVDVVAIGSGLGEAVETEELFLELLKKIDKPLIIDGNGLTMLSHNTKFLETLDKEIILTPHLGEFARLLDVDVSTMEKKKFDYLREGVRRFKASIVLKGAFSLIGEKNGEILINPSGNSGMATAGSGDVLVGVIAAMIAGGKGIEKSLELGVFIHGLSGDLQAKIIGEDGLTATDILSGIPDAIRFFREHYQEIKECNYERARIT